MALSPKVYQRGFQEAIQEFDRYEQIKRRLNQIKACQQLKKGEAFLKLIEAA
ncbi:hypothetical protein [Roseivirga thermotolerans]|uniref:hypothetical protein n=1 Tax=Roseivirga thermotolerans TaxID=1758176 RepID=UPI00273F1A91|nr:hypothetical protein [Roseivirga thermotolerans]MEC7752957.1 hypothetical protein [Bacteroidota bacterium]